MGNPFDDLLSRIALHKPVPTEAKIGPKQKLPWKSSKTKDQLVVEANNTLRMRENNATRLPKKKNIRHIIYRRPNHVYAVITSDQSSSPWHPHCDLGKIRIDQANSFDHVDLDTWNQSWLMRLSQLKGLPPRPKHDQSGRYDGELGHHLAEESLRSVLLGQLQAKQKVELVYPPLITFDIEIADQTDLGRLKKMIKDKLVELGYAYYADKEYKMYYSKNPKAGVPRSAKEFVYSGDVSRLADQKPVTADWKTILVEEIDPGALSEDTTDDDDDFGSGHGPGKKPPPGQVPQDQEQQQLEQAERQRLQQLREEERRRRQQEQREEEQRQQNEYEAKLRIANPGITQQEVDVFVKTWKSLRDEEKARLLSDLQARIDNDEGLKIMENVKASVQGKVNALKKEFKKIVEEGVPFLGSKESRDVQKCAGEYLHDKGVSLGDMEMSIASFVAYEVLAEAATLWAGTFKQKLEDSPGKNMSKKFIRAMDKWWKGYRQPSEAEKADASEVYKAILEIIEEVVQDYDPEEPEPPSNKPIEHIFERDFKNPATVQYLKQRLKESSHGHKFMHFSEDIRQSPWEVKAYVQLAQKAWSLIKKDAKEGLEAYNKLPAGEQRDFQNRHEDVLDRLKNWYQPKVTHKTLRLKEEEISDKEIHRMIDDTILDVLLAQDLQLMYSDPAKIFEIIQQKIDARPRQSGFPTIRGSGAGILKRPSAGMKRGRMDGADSSSSEEESAPKRRKRELKKKKVTRFSLPLDLFAKK